MVKLRGKQKWKHVLTVEGELWALERELDSMSQKIQMLTSNQEELEA